MDFYLFTLYLSIIIFLVGSLGKIIKWFSKNPPFEGFGFEKGISRAADNLINAISAQGFSQFIKKIVLDVIFQAHILKKEPFRWLMHIFIFWGFTGLLIMHALDDLIILPFFPDYSPCLNPFLFLRNFFGFMVMAGIFMAVWRRLKTPVLRKTTRKSDWTALVFLFLIISSGFLLESVKILSPEIFYDMADSYLVTDDPTEMENLKAYWAENFGVAFTDFSFANYDKEYGKQVHLESCAACHSGIESAFVSYPLSGILKPFSMIINGLKFDTILFYIHFLLCFAALAFLPFGKFFHIFATPVNILCQKEKDVPYGLFFDSCTNCGACSAGCSVYPLFQVFGNSYILPSEKLKFLGSIKSHKNMEPLENFALGNFMCTECMRCTNVCPSDINLMDLWIKSKKEMKKQGFSDFYSLMPKISLISLTENLTDNPETFWACVQCTTCTSVCPVVGAAKDPEKELDLTPQQIMNLMRLNLKELALGSAMLWDCLTCYKCQEHCPQDVPVADVMYELRNIAFSGDIKKEGRF